MNILVLEFVKSLDKWDSWPEVDIFQENEISLFL